MCLTKASFGQFFLQPFGTIQFGLILQQVVSNLACGVARNIRMELLEIARHAGRPLRLIYIVGVCDGRGMRINTTGITYMQIFVRHVYNYIYPSTAC